MAKIQENFWAMIWWHGVGSSSGCSPVPRGLADMDAPLSAEYYQTIDRLTAEGLRIGGSLGTVCSCEYYEGTKACMMQRGRWCHHWEQVL